MICIRDTLSLAELFVSEACLPRLEDQDHIEVAGEPRSLPFDEEGYLPWPAG